MRGLFVTASDTGVGKTQVTAALAQALLAEGVRVRVRKPIQAGGRDAELLAEAAGDEPVDQVCRFSLKTPTSPERAARLEGVRVRMSALVEACESPDPIVVEGAGGLLSPLCEDGLNADLARQLGLPLIVVVADRLGAINQALLVVDAAKSRKLKIAAIALNGGGDNADDVGRWTGVPVIPLPHSKDRPPYKGLVPALREAVRRGTIPRP